MTTTNRKVTIRCECGAFGPIPEGGCVHQRTDDWQISEFSTPGETLSADEWERKHGPAFFEYDGTTGESRYGKGVHLTDDGFHAISFASPPRIPWWRRVWNRVLRWLRGIK